jgi:hypothetical protein
LTDDLADGATESGSERPALQDSPDRVACRIIEILGDPLLRADCQGRRAFLMELAPLYCDVIVQRFEKFTGTKAQRSGAAAAR